jgi:hydrogenase maturation protease
MLRVLIVGFGNPLRSDDGLGWLVAKQLSGDLARDDVQVFAAYQLTPEFAELASRSERMLFIDASCTGAPGTLNCKRIVPAAPSSQFSHELTPAAILKLAEELYGRCPVAYLLTVAGESFETGEHLSPAVVAAIPALVEQIRELIEDAGECGQTESDGR